MADFEKAVEIVLRHEGGYVNDPVDPGGETNFGISKRSYPHEDIRNMTRDRAKEIYFRDFWQPWKDLAQSIAEKGFDLAVNCGRAPVVKMLQSAICALRPGSVDVDGVIGPHTVAAANALDEAALLGALKAAALQHYQAIVVHNPNLGKFLRAWTARVMS